MDISVPGLLGFIQRAKQHVKARAGLLVDNPQEFVRQLGDETKARMGEGTAGDPESMAELQSGEWVNSPYGRNAVNLGMALMAPAKPAKTAHELAHKTAQKNATEMLGLPPNNTAMDRAKALGYDTNTQLYRGTTQNEVNHAGQNVWMTTEPEVANFYSFGLSDGKNLAPGTSPNVMPVLAHGDFVHPDNGVKLWAGGTAYQIPAEYVRSRFAAFDPARAKVPDFLAGVLPFGLLDYTDFKSEKKASK